MDSATGLPESIRTERLLLRRWRASDLESFVAVNADPVVCEFLPATLTRVQSEELAAKIAGHFDEHGFGMWVVEIPGEASFAGFVGLAHATFEASFTPCVEVGWRLASAFWGRGFATEAARASLAFGFSQLSLKEILAWTVPDNQRSRRVMEKLGMTHDAAEDFDHPRLPEGHRLRRHVLYRARRG
jgi:ribosomal-protein-alanine N-acetyltransferase